MLHPCKACCSAEPQIFIYIDTARSGIPYAFTIALALLAFLSTSLITSVIPLLSCPCFFNSFHTFSTVWNKQFKIQQCDRHHSTSHSMKHGFSSPWLSQHAAAHFMTHTYFTGIWCLTDNTIWRDEGILRGDVSTCYRVLFKEARVYTKIFWWIQISVTVGQENYFISNHQD